jgi:hypothetical protein
MVDVETFPRHLRGSVLQKKTVKLRKIDERMMEYRQKKEETR